MSRRRSTTLLLGGLALLSGLALYLIYLAYDRLPDPVPVQTESPAVAPPTRSPEIIRDHPGRPVRNVVFRFNVLADLLPPQNRPIFRVVQGDIELLARIEVLAGVGSAGHRALVGEHLLKVWLPGEDKPIYRIAEVSGTETWSDCVLNGRREVTGSVSDSRGDALAGARVWLAGAETTTDTGGRFRFESVHCGPGTPIAVIAKGHSSLYRILDLQSTSADTLDFALESGSTIAGRVLVPEGMDAGDARVFVFALQGSDMQTSLLQYPFFLQAVEGGLRPDADGLVEIPSLPPNVELGVLVRHPKMESMHTMVRLKRSVANVLLKPKPGKNLLSGRLQDEEGKPVVGALLFCPGPPNRIRFALPSDADPALPWLARSGKDGRFTLVVSDDGEQKHHEVRAYKPGRVGLSFSIKELEGKRDIGRSLLMPQPAGRASDTTPRVQLRCADSWGRKFRVEVREWDHVVASNLPWSDKEVFEQRLHRPVLTDLTVEVEGMPPIKLENLVVAGPVALSPIETKR